MLFVVLANALVMAPAPFTDGRNRNPQAIGFFASLRGYLAAMFLLAIGLCIDVFLVMMLSWSSEMVALISWLIVRSPAFLYGRRVQQPLNLFERFFLDEGSSQPR